MTEAQAEAIARDYLAAGSREGLCDKHGISPAMLDRILRQYRIAEKIAAPEGKIEPSPYQPFRAPGVELFEKRSSDRREE